MFWKTFTLGWCVCWLLSDGFLSRLSCGIKFIYRPLLYMYYWNGCKFSTNLVCQLGFLQRGCENVVREGPENWNCEYVTRFLLTIQCSNAMPVGEKGGRWNNAEEATTRDPPLVLHAPDIRISPPPRLFAQKQKNIAEGKGIWKKKEKGSMKKQAKRDSTTRKKIEGGIKMVRSVAIKRTIE